MHRVTVLAITILDGLIKSQKLKYPFRSAIYKLECKGARILRAQCDKKPTIIFCLIFKGG